MKMNRRVFLSWAALVGASVAESSRSEESEDQSRLSKFSVLQGMTDQTSTEISIVLPNDEGHKVLVRGPGNTFIQPTISRRIHKFDSDYCVLKLKLENLSLDEVYQLEITDEPGRVIDKRTFSTLDLEMDRPNIAVTSCMNDHFHRKALWEELRQAKPDMVFMVGDAVYADHPSLFKRKLANPKQLWDRFITVRNKLYFYHFDHLIPTLGIWDDHDYGANNSNKSYPYSEESIENYNTFFAQNLGNKNIEAGPGCSNKFTAFGQEFYFLDGRSFRTGEEDATESLFGQKQESWLYNHLKNSKKFAWMISGSQWFGKYFEKEAYEYTHPNSFSSFLTELSGFDRKVGFISGDVHFSELMTIEKEILGYETLEITSSSMHSLTFPGMDKGKENPRRVDSCSTAWHNFNIIVPEAKGNDLKVSIDCRLSTGRAYYHKMKI